MGKKGKPSRKILISLKDWEQMHPFLNRYSTDKYYCNLANHLAVLINVALEPSGFYTQQNIKDLALAVTAYFEDAVSELGMWRAFIEKHKQMYGRWLPWYDTSEEYYEDEINLQDIQFVLWINMMRMRKGNIINPENPVLHEMAVALYAFLESEFEEAPINEELVDEFYAPETTETFGKLKALLSWMGSSSYLLKPSISTDSEKEEMQETLDDLLHLDEHPGLSEYVVDSYFGVSKPTGTLALLPCEWYALMREQKGITEDNEEIRKIKLTPLYPFIIARNNGEGDLLLRSVRGIEYEVVRNSFEDGSEAAIKENYLIFTILAYYKGKWHINGFSSLMKTKGKEDVEKQLEDFGKDLKDKAGIPLDLLGNYDFDATDIFQMGMDSKLAEKAIKANNGSRLFYFSSLKEAREWQAKAFNLKGHGELPKDTSSISENKLAIYIAKDGRLCIVPSVELIADPDNPFFKDRTSESQLGALVDKSIIPTELVSYLIEKGYMKHVALKSIFGEERGHQLLQDNIFFLATYMRQEHT